MNILRKLSDSFLLLLGLAISVLIVFFSIMNYKELGAVANNSKATLMMVAYFGIALFLVLIPDKWWVKLIILGLIIGVSSYVRYLWVTKVQTVTASDFSALYNASVGIGTGSNKDYLKESGYFQVWAYQNGFVLWQSFLIKLFGSKVLTLQIGNIVTNAFTTLGVYLLGKEVGNHRVGLISSFMYAFYLPSIFMTSVLTNQTIATMFYIFGFYFIFVGHRVLVGKEIPLRSIITPKTNDLGIEVEESIAVKDELSNVTDDVENGSYFGFIFIFLGALGILFGNITRPLAPVILVAIVLFYLVYRLIKLKDLKGLIKPFISLAIIFSVFFGGMFITNTAIKSSGIADYGLINRNPTWKFVTGLDQKSKGTYSAEKLDKLSKATVGKKRDALGKKMIKSEIKDKKALIKLFGKKFKFMWSGEDTAISWAVNNPMVAYNPTNMKVKLGYLIKAQKMQWIGIFALLIAGTLASFKLWGKRLSKYNNIILLNIVWFGYVAVHLLIEIQTRYRYFAMPLLIIIGAYGIVSFFTTFNCIYDHSLGYIDNLAGGYYKNFDNVHWNPSEVQNVNIEDSTINTDISNNLVSNDVVSDSDNFKLDNTEVKPKNVEISNINSNKDDNNNGNDGGLINPF